MSELLREGSLKNSGGPKDVILKLGGGVEKYELEEVVNKSFLEEVLNESFLMGVDDIG